jgi:hypothetical protein
MTPRHAHSTAYPAAASAVRRALTFACVLMTLIAGTTSAQQPAGDVPKAPAKPSDILVDRPDADPGEGADLLGDVYESKGHGIALRPPKESVIVRRIGAKEIIEFVNEKAGWVLQVGKIMLPQPGSLTEYRDRQGNLQPGLLEFTVKQLKEENPDAEILRQEMTNVTDGDVGLIAARTTQNLRRQLIQRAIVQKTDQLYYLITLRTPGAAKGAKDDEAATSERLAVETFRQVLDSVKLLDLGAVRADQDARLFRTRGFLVNLSSDKLKGALARQRWMRVIKNGKDVGYTYVEEKTELKGAQEGVEIRVRSRLLPQPDLQVDSGSILFTSVDLRHEDWSTLTEYVDLKARAKQGKAYKAPQLTESGVSDRRAVPGRGDTYNLQVLFESTRERLEPVGRDLPPFYLPQAISHMLPRLLPTGEPKGFMFMVYVPETREVMARYVDVKELRKVELGNVITRAVPVEDRVGLEGPVTVHYITPDGKWVGSENKETGVTMLPSDEETLVKLWKDADLSPPEAPGAKDAANPQAAAEGDGADNPAPETRQKTRGAGAGN